MLSGKSANSQSQYIRIVNTPKVLRLVTIITIISSVVINIAYSIYQEIDKTSFSLILLTAGSLLIYWMIATDKFMVAGVSFYLLGSGILIYNLGIGGAVFDEAIIALPLIIIFASILFGKRYVPFITIISILEIGGLYLLDDASLINPFEGRIQISLEEYMTTMIILAGLGLLMWVVVDIIETAVNRIVFSERQLEKAYDLTLRAWTKALELRGREIEGHSLRVTALSIQLGHKLGLSKEQLEQLRLGALLHDIGKMNIPESILLKPGPLTDEEWELIKKHTRVAVEIFKDISYLNDAMKVVCCHHEQLDGKGYPLNLVREDIPIEAKIFSVVDSWDVILSDRPYSSAWSDEKARSYLISQSGKKFDSEIVSALFELIEENNLEKH